MQSIDNSELIATFLPEQPIAGVFWYTELLDRTKKVGGNNRYRLLRAFKHHDQFEFLDQMPMIRELCDQTGIRAYIRLSPRSYEQVGKDFARRVLDAALLEHWHDMSHLYASSCGRCSIHGRKLWLYDVDVIDEASRAFEIWLREGQLLVTTIPSRKGCHLIAKPHDPAHDPRPASIELHKDNPTNLYIPATRDETWQSVQKLITNA